MQEKPKKTTKKSTIKSKVKKVASRFAPKQLKKKPKNDDPGGYKIRSQYMDVAEENLARQKKILDKLEPTARHMKAIDDSAKAKKKRK